MGGLFIIVMLPLLIIAMIAALLILVAGGLIAFTLFDQWVNNYLLAPAD